MDCQMPVYWPNASRISNFVCSSLLKIHQYNPAFSESYLPISKMNCWTQSLMCTELTCFSLQSNYSFDLYNTDF